MRRHELTTAHKATNLSECAQSGSVNLNSDGTTFKVWPSIPDGSANSMIAEA